MNESELHVNFLLKASAALTKIQSNETQQILRSHYLLKCKKMSGFSKLGKKQFSHEARCPHCYIEWIKKTEIKVKPIKLSKMQRRRIRSKGKHKKPRNKKHLLNSNIMEKVCSFCSHPTIKKIRKPNKSYKKTVSVTNQTKEVTPNQSYKQIKKPTESPKLQKVSKVENNPLNIDRYQSNVYYDSRDAFSLDKKNTLISRIKEPKIIKNNKKKKDKFAGLCRTAVIAAAKIKQEKDKQNKLNLFLRPST